VYIKNDALLEQRRNPTPGLLALHYYYTKVKAANMQPDEVIKHLNLRKDDHYISYDTFKDYLKYGKLAHFLVVNECPQLPVFKEQLSQLLRLKVRTLDRDFL